LGVKSADPVDSALRNIEESGKFLYRAFRQIMESLLDFLENRDEFFPVGRMSGENFFEFSLFLGA
jgi:hypothetical protein